MKISYHASMNLMSVLEHFVTTIINIYKERNMKKENSFFEKEKNESDQV
jgi:hypothetical protein